jgi:sigma-B regulation protein RsbU (phosphoserine phosphatase)
MKVRIGWVEKTFLILLLVYSAVSWFFGPALLAVVLKLLVAIFAIWSGARLSRVLVQRLLWRLRTRLIVAYIFIALVPIVLITTLAVLGAALVSGQLSVYLVTSELDRRIASLQNTVDFLARNDPELGPSARGAGPYLQTRFPGVRLRVEGDNNWTFPADSTVEAFPASWKEGSGLLLRAGSLYGWAYARSSSRRVTAVFPITRDYLGLLAPDLGESTVLDIQNGRAVVHQSPSMDAPSRNRLPPPMNRADFEVRWGAPLPVQLWESAPDTDHEWLTIRTRISAVMRTVFSQEVDYAKDLIWITFFAVAILFLLAEVVALVLGISITKTITGAVHELYEGTLRVTKGDFSHRIPTHGRDQLAELAVSFNHMTENMQRLLAVEKERERLQAELEIAREVQNQLYPRQLPQLSTLHLTAMCDPARMVSGDYYDYQQLDAKKAAIVIGDVAGKGISAALLMATVQSSFRSQLRSSVELATNAEDHRSQISVSTSHVVSSLNQQLYADTSPEKYATFYLGVYDEGTSTLTYTNAGHLPPVHIHNGAASRLDVNGMVVGAFPSAQYEESRLKLEPGDLLVFFTDGITEPEDAYGEMFGEERLIDIALKNMHLGDRALMETIVQSVRQWTGSGELQDDMTLMIVRRRQE